MSEYALQIATDADEGLVTDQIRSGHEECGVFTQNKFKVEAKVKELIGKSGCFVILEGTAPIGSFALDTFVSWYTDAERLQDVWFYIEPEARSMKAFRFMIDAMIGIAKHNKKPLYLGVATTGAGRKRSLMMRTMMETLRMYEIEYRGGEFKAT